jgi:hypothetical protein
MTTTTWKAGGRKSGRLEQATKTTNEIKIKKGWFSYIDVLVDSARNLPVLGMGFVLFVHKHGVGGIFDMILA